jgi:hypothetical protein
MRRLASGAIGLLIFGAGCASSSANPAAGSHNATPTTGVAVSAAGDLAGFCTAVHAVAQGIAPAETPGGVAQAHQEIDAIAQSAPAQIHTQATEMAAQLDAVVDAFATFGYNAQRVLTEGSPQVRATLKRLASEASGNPPSEPDASVLVYADAHCGHGSPTPTSAPALSGPSFTYTLTGTGIVNVYYLTAAGMIGVSGLRLGGAWSKNLPVTPTKASSINAQIFAGGPVTCTITEGEVVLKTNTASGPGQSATCLAILR